MAKKRGSRAAVHAEEPKDAASAVESGDHKAVQHDDEPELVSNATIAQSDIVDDDDDSKLAAELARELKASLNRHADPRLFLPVGASDSSRGKPRSSKLQGSFLQKQHGVTELSSGFTKSLTSESEKQAVLRPAAVGAEPVPVTEEDVKRQHEDKKPDTAGSKWFNLPATEVTPEIRNDFRVIAMRAHLDPKRFYKKDKTLRKIPKYFQLGTVVEGAGEFYSGRLSQRERTQHYTEEILQDIDRRKYLKRKYQNIQAKQQSVKRFGRAGPTKKRRK